MKILKSTLIVIAAGILLFSCDHQAKEQSDESSKEAKPLAVTSAKEEPEKSADFITDTISAPQQFQDEDKKGLPKINKPEPKVDWDKKPPHRAMWETRSGHPGISTRRAERFRCIAHGADRPSDHRK